MNNPTTYAEPDETYAAYEQEAFEAWCDDMDVDPETEEAALAWRAFCEDEARAQHTEDAVAELEWRRQDEQDYMDSLREW